MRERERERVGEGRYSACTEQTFTSMLPLLDFLFCSLFLCVLLSLSYSLSFSLPHSLHCFPSISFLSLTHTHRSIYIYIICACTYAPSPSPSPSPAPFFFNFFAPRRWWRRQCAEYPTPQPRRTTYAAPAQSCWRSRPRRCPVHGRSASREEVKI